MLNIWSNIKLHRGEDVCYKMGSCYSTCSNSLTEIGMGLKYVTQCVSAGQTALFLDRRLDREVLQHWRMPQLTEQMFPTGINTAWPLKVAKPEGKNTLWYSGGLYQHTKHLTSSAVVCFNPFHFIFSPFDDCSLVTFTFQDEFPPSFWRTFGWSPCWLQVVILCLLRISKQILFGKLVDLDFCHDPITC